MGHNTPFGIPPNTSHKVPPTCTDSGEKGDEALSLAASNLFFQGNENEIRKVVHSRSAKENHNHSSASGSTHDADQKYWFQSTEEYMMMSWKLDLKYCLLWPQQQKSFGRSH